MSDETSSPREVRGLSKGETGSLVAFPRARGRPSDNLPLELTSFIGREMEIAELKRLLAGRRLVTLCGPGGCGKTRLALAVAQDLVEGFEDGVWWVELASLSDPKLMPRAAASVLGVREAPDRSLTEVLVEHLKGRKTLLVLDNCEHLVEGCAVLADALLRACPELGILATSREPLRIAGETTWVVPSLSLPDTRRLPPVAELARYEAVHLFVERAGAVDAGFALTARNASAVARLCNELDGIPLAIELAAARVRVLTVEQISEKLEDPLGLLTTGSRTAASRHQTLRATLQWSYELLSEAERALFRRLSVFAGGWALEAAEAVGAGGPVEAGRVLDLLSNLVDKSLVVVEAEAEGPLRYRMLEPIRQYGREKLRESQEAPEVRRRHAEHYLAFAETAEPELLGADQGRWLGRLRTEFGNLREAHSWSLEPGQEAERARLRLRLPAALWRFWGGQRFEEGKRWLQTALERDHGGFPAIRARALDGLGFILLFQQDYERAIAALEEAIALYKELGDGSGTAFALANLGYAVLHGDYRERVTAFVEEAEALMAGDLDGHARAYLRTITASAALGQGDLDSAVAQLEEGLALCRELGDLRNTSMSLFILGMIELVRGDVARGATLLEEGARITRELGDRLGTIYFAWGLGKLSALRGKPVRAAKLWGAAEDLREQMGMPLSRFDLAVSGYERDLAAVRSALDEASFDAAWAEGRALSPEQAIEYALGEPTTPGEEMPADQPAHAPLGRPEEDGYRRHNLPVAQSGFVGREREMSEVKRTLSMTRLLTLTGTGGCGKTRLALEVARDLADAYPDGVWLMELASLSEGALVPGAVAAALGVREQPDLPVIDTLVDYLRSRRILLVLDNCEHLIEACVRLVDTLLSSCEHLRVLATSREALGVVGEVNWIVPSLTVPDAERLPDLQNLTRYEAVQLFVERARFRLPAFVITPENAPAVVDVCRRLDGIPLAIEFATARMGALAVEQIAERLGDSLGFLTTGDRTRAPRHRTLRAALAWSYELLSEPEQRLFERLSVFAGGWALEAAEAVGAGEGIERENILNLLGGLVDKSLVVAEGGPEGALRYRMLEPVRQYGRERLEETGAVQNRHAAFFLALAEQADPELKGPGQISWLKRLDAEQDNLRAAMAWLLGKGEPEMCARLGWALWLFWWIRCRFAEGRRWMEEALAKGGATSARARALFVAGTMACGQADWRSASALLEESLVLFRELGDKKGAGYALSSAGFAAIGQDRQEEGVALLEEAVELSLEVGEKWAAAFMLCFLATVWRNQGDSARAERLAEKGLALSREVGDREGTSVALYILAGLAHASSDHTLALRLFEEGLGLSLEVGDATNVAYCLEGIAAVAASEGKPVRAARLWGAAEVLLQKIEAAAYVYAPDRSLHQSQVAAARSTLGEEAFAAAWTEGRTMALEEAIEYALGTVDEPADAPPTMAPVTKRTPSGQKPAEAVEARAATAGLRIFALGPARVEKDGRPFDPSADWIHKPRELLFYLLSHPPRTKEQIGLALWPEASTAQLRSSFHDTVYRLRRALGAKEWIVFEKGHYTLNRSLDYFFDVETFEENLSEARRVQAKAPERAILHLQEAAGLYGGDFLEDTADREWAMDRQEELRREYQEALLLLGRLLFAQERHGEAAEAYRKVIAHDELLEEAHRELMRCLAALGERGRALRHYEELVGLLEEQLDASPAPETVALHERLRAGEGV